MNALTLKSPAKLNLYLRVLGKRSDGYHRLETLYHRISLADTLSLKKTKRGITLACRHPQVPLGRDNLITRAYALLKKAEPDLGGVHVRLQKKIPMGGGLGGGSSNAATFLLGAKRLYGLRTPLKKLAYLGAQLGADVPFFLYQVPQAWGTGVGEKINPCKSLRRKWFVLVLAEEGLSTRNVYQTLEIGRLGASLTKPTGVARIAFHLEGSSGLWETAKWLHNDLERPAIKLNSEISKNLGTLVQCGAPAVSMTGSGSTVFALFFDQQEARAIAKKLSEYIPSNRIRICHTF